MKIVVIDSTRGGKENPLPHNTYAIVYTPSWLRLRAKFSWRTTVATLKAVELMKEYYMTAEIREKPIRAQRCYYVIKSLNIFGTDRLGSARFSVLARDTLAKHKEALDMYLAMNPVVAWDWAVSWTECRAMVQAFPEEYVSMYRRLRSHHSTRHKPKNELMYFLSIMENVAQEFNTDMEYR
jgi:hypothetical protein